MLDDETVLKNCYYWAKRLVCKGIDFDALVSVGYIVGKPLRDKKLLKDWLHYSMLKFIITELNNRRMCVNLGDNYAESIRTASDSSNYLDLYESIKRANLSKRELAVLRETFFKFKNQTEIAALLNIKQQTVSVYLRRALEKVRNAYLKGISK